MLQLSQDIKRLIVQAAIAAPNYLLMKQAKDIMSGFSALHLGRRQHRMASALVYVGLRRPHVALSCLQHLEDTQAQALRSAIQDQIEQMKTNTLR
jgi:type III secretion system SsaH family protein